MCRARRGDPARRAPPGAATGAVTFARSLGAAVGVATSGAILAARLSDGLSSLGGGIDVQAITEHGLAAMHGFSTAQYQAVADAYRGALTGCFLLSGVVMSAAFVLVFGLPEIALRDHIESEVTGKLPEKLID